MIFLFFFFNDTATTEIYTLSLHDALPISAAAGRLGAPRRKARRAMKSRLTRKSGASRPAASRSARAPSSTRKRRPDRKSTRLNSSHSQISYAVFCLKKKKKNDRDSGTDIG